MKNSVDIDEIHWTINRKTIDRDFLRAALLEGFEHDPTPIAANDYAAILRRQGDSFTNRDVHEALEWLQFTGKIDRDMMYDKVCGSHIWHYFAKDWDGTPSEPQPEGGK